MSFLIDDEFKETAEERISPTTEQYNDLKDYIKSVVRSAGGKLDYCIIGTLCHQQFPSVFTWGELEQTFAVIQSEWDVKRPITLEAKIMARDSLLGDLKKENLGNEIIGK